MEIRLILEGKEKFYDKLKRLTSVKFGRALRDSAVYMKSSVIRNFEVGGRPPWAPLALSTLKWKLKKGYSTKPLILTGRLRASINISYSETEALVASGVTYGVFHQVGTSKIPARPFLVFQPEDVDAITRIFSKVLEEELKK